MRTFCTDEGRFRSLIWLMLAAKVVVEGLHISPYTLGRSRFSTKLCSAENQQPSSPMYGEDEDFLQLFQETSMEGIGLAREFNRQQLQRQAQLREEQERLEEVFQISPTNSAGFFDTAPGNHRVQSVPSMQRRKSETPAAAMNEDNWLLIFATSMAAQYPQDMLVLEEPKDHQALLFLITMSLLFALSAMAPMPEFPVVDTSSFTTSASLLSSYCC